MAPLPALAVGAGHAQVPAASVVKVRAVAADGEVIFGSAVAIGHERLATTCHVTRRATRIEILVGGEVRIAQEQTGSPLHDLCVLAVRDLDLPAVRMRRSEDLALGEPVVAAGFEAEAAALTMTAGTVKGLYRYDEGRVIRTSAGFDFGSSGGGLFDAAGNLVGLLAFKARTGTELRFALPSEWIAAVGATVTKSEPVGPTAQASAFWERSATHRPAFLGVALREAAAAGR